MITVLIFVGVVLAFTLVTLLVVLAPGDFPRERCTGDALSGFLPCSHYPDCDCS